MYLQYQSEFDVSVDALRDFHFSPNAFSLLTPPWEPTEVVEAPEKLSEGARAVLQVRIGPIKLRWVAVHRMTDLGFIDLQKSGPFSHWEHEHRFEPLAQDRCRLTDAISCKLPFGWVGQFTGNRFLQHKLDRLFDYRHTITKQQLEGAP